MGRDVSGTSSGDEQKRLLFWDAVVAAAGRRGEGELPTHPKMLGAPPLTLGRRQL